MATKKTSTKKSTAKTKTETTTPAPKKKTYRSGDITRLSIIGLMLGIVFTVGLVLGLGLGAKMMRYHIAGKFKDDNIVILKDEIKEEVLAELEEATLNVPSPEQETPVVDTLEEDEPIDLLDEDEAPVTRATEEANAENESN